MIFVTNGTQLPFPRLVRMVNDWASDNVSEKIIIQDIAAAKSNTLKNVTYKNVLSPVDYRHILFSCELVVGHFGTGTIISASEANKPALLMARQLSLKEHRNSHQEMTAAAFSEKQGIYEFNSNRELNSLLSNRANLLPVKIAKKENRYKLIDEIKTQVSNME